MDTVRIKQGEVAVNSKLANHLGLKPGDDILVRFTKISDIPSNAPFAPDKESDASIVLSVGSIISPGQTGNFSLGISQIVPLNIFLNLSDLEKISDLPKINRLIIEKRNDITPSIVYKCLKESILPEDIGLTFRLTGNNYCLELISGRIFIGQEIVDDIVKSIPTARPVLTYLANSIAKDR